MLLQAAGFAVLAALSPTALLITAIYLGSARPRTTAVCYLAGAVLISTVMGVAVLLMLALLVAGAVLAVDGLLGLIGRT
jgi:hypothetical protein